jgi:hypothetical protein
MLENNGLSRELLACYGYEVILSKNPIMSSYINEDKGLRLNYYFTTGTLTVQNKSGKFQKWPDVTNDNVEEVLCQIIKEYDITS